MKRIVVGITGATGAPLAVRVLQFLYDLEIEVHLIVSQWARATLLQECGLSAKDIKSYASVVHDACDQAASISRPRATASGSTGSWMAPRSTAFGAAQFDRHRHELVGRDPVPPAARLSPAAHRPRAATAHRTHRPAITASQRWPATWRRSWPMPGSTEPRWRACRSADLDGRCSSHA